MLSTRAASIRAFAGALLIPLLAVPVAAQTSQAAVSVASRADAPGKKPLTIEDYGRWRTIEDARISGDGRWVSYALRHINVLPVESKPVLHLHDVDGDSDVEIENAHNAEFSPDSRWLVYQVDSVRARGGRGGRGASPDTTGAPPDTTGGAPPDSVVADRAARPDDGRDAFVAAHAGDRVQRAFDAPAAASPCDRRRRRWWARWHGRRQRGRRRRERITRR
jgi:hypothetical protein